MITEEISEKLCEVKDIYIYIYLKCKINRRNEEEDREKNWR